MAMSNLSMVNNHLYLGKYIERMLFIFITLTNLYLDDYSKILATFIIFKDCRVKWLIF